MADVGKWQGDAIRNITGRFGLVGNSDVTTATGIFSQTNSLAGGSFGGSNQRCIINMNASTQVPTSDENRPKTIKMVYCIRAFGTPVNQGLIDITALANEVAGKQQAISYIQIQDEKPSGTAGGTFTSGAWRTRDLNKLKTYLIS